jgi:hypothetical protein
MHSTFLLQTWFGLEALRLESAELKTDSQAKHKRYYTMSFKAKYSWRIFVPYNHLLVLLISINMQSNAIDGQDKGFIVRSHGAGFLWL